ncbi:MAG: dephospho-CoA kinase, partial [Oscillospiraceae bacterium]
YYIDCDKIARLVTEKGSPLLEELASAFGPEILKETGELDRKELAVRAFATKEATRLLNSITHPAIKKLVDKKVKGAFFDGYDVAIIDAPALFESGIQNSCDIIVSVVADEQTRLQRIMLRDYINEESAKLRMKAQLDEEYYKSHSDIIIHNDNNFHDLKEQLSELVDLIEVKRNEAVT